MATLLDVSCHVFEVDNVSAWKKSLEGKTVLLNAAGPFRYTAQQAMDACQQAGVHYLDIGAKLETYLLAESKDTEAMKAGLQLMSGAGLFVSYDALAVHLSTLVEDPQN